MKTLFNRIKLFLFFLAMTTSLNAQNDLNREVGIRFSNFNNFGFIHKKKKADQKFRRIRLGSTSLGFTTNQGRQALEFNANIAIGIEKRKALGERFQFITGTEFLGSFNLALNGNAGLANISPGVGFVLGFQYAIANRFLISLETIPSVRVNFGLDENGFQDRIGINAGFNSQAASLSLVYQFKSKKA